MDNDLDRRLRELTDRVARLERELQLKPREVQGQDVQGPIVQRPKPFVPIVPIVPVVPVVPVVPLVSPWELNVGANWLNRIGVVTIVIGIALAVGYTVGHTGPLGRVAIGYAMSVVLLGGGVWLERKPEYRSYAYGLVAGGWGATYFTAYAMHALDAARVIESDLIGTAALVVVAAGMVVHSLTYRSQTVTGLAYLIGYATLALTPLSGFALVATVPLSASLLFVAQRFGWERMSTVGLLATYAIFLVREGTAILAWAEMPGVLEPYLALGAYWLTFEVGDILALRRRRDDAGAGTPLFALNAIAFTGALFLQLPSGADPLWFSNVLCVAALAYLASAIVRAHVLGPRARATEVAASFSGASQGAIGMAAGLAIGAMLLRFDGPREVVALLLTAELLFVAGLVLGDRVVRVWGAGAAIVTVFRAMMLVEAAAPLLDWPWAMHDWSPALAVAAIAFYVNREVLRSRALDPIGIERHYALAASMLVGQVLWGEVPARYLGLALLAGASVLIEAGLRRAAEYRYQAYAFGALGLMLVVESQVSSAESSPAVLLAASALAYAVAGRLAWHARTQPSVNDLKYGAGAAACAGTGLLVFFEWRVAPEAVMAAAWAATALVLVSVGVWRRLPLFVAQGHMLVLAGAARATARVVMLPMREGGADAMWAIPVIAVLFAAGVLGRRSIGDRKDATAELEDALRIVTLIAASASVVILILHEVEASAVTLALGLTGVLLVGGGVPLGERVLRRSGLAVFALAIAKLFVSDLVSLEGLTRIVSFIASGTVLLAVSWAYTRFREQIRRYL